MYKIQIFILCKNRLNYFVETLNSALNLDFKDFELIISDNSDNNKIENYIKANNFDLKYIKRKQSLTALEHYKVLFEEASKDYVIFFHDDDLLDRNYLSEMFALISSDPNLVAVGCNAYYLKNNKKLKKTFTNLNNNLVINDVQTIIKSYMEIGELKHVPFSSYIYRTSKIKDLTISKNKGGKYSDFFFLTKLINKGKILWNSNPLMSYRIHSNNDSASESILDRINLISNICNEYNFNRNHETINQYKIKYLFSFYKKDILKFKSRKKIIFKFLFFKFINMFMFNSSFRKYMLRKFFI